jgi:hypothetical protein
MLTVSLTMWLARVLGPVLRPVSRWLLAPERERPTWHYETGFALVILLGTALLTTPEPWMHMGDRFVLKAFFVNWLSAFAVLGSFLHAKVGYRMSEAMAEMNAPSVSCWEWSGRYWLGKEILWFSVFLLSGAYPAIAGNVIFILYPAWRRIHVEERRKLRGGK